MRQPGCRRRGCSGSSQRRSCGGFQCSQGLGSSRSSGGGSREAAGRHAGPRLRGPGGTSSRAEQGCPAARAQEAGAPGCRGSAGCRGRQRRRKRAGSSGGRVGGQRGAEAAHGASAGQRGCAALHAQQPGLEPGRPARLPACWPLLPAHVRPQPPARVPPELLLPRLPDLSPPAGLLAVSCSWGSVQEASALLHLAAAFPRSQLAEVDCAAPRAGAARCR